MPDLKEIFDLVGDAVEPDRDAWSQQERRHRRASRSRKVGAIAVAATFMAVVVAVTTVTWNHRSTGVLDSPRFRSGIYRIDLMSGSETLLRGSPWSYLDRWDVAFSPVDGMIAFVNDRQSAAQVFVMNQDGSGLRQLTHDPRQAQFPVWSIDGTRVAYLGFGRGVERNVFVVELGTGKTTQVTHERRDVTQVDWSPSGNELVYSTSIPGVEDQTSQYAPQSSSVLKVVDLATERTTRIAGDRRHTVDFGDWSPVDDRIAFMTGYEWGNGLYGFEPGELWTMAPDGGDRRLLFSADDRMFNPTWSPDGTRIAFSKEDGASFNSYVIDVATRETRMVGAGVFPIWLDEDTLIVRID
jgi:Tol biopolymer transport system component